MTRVERAAQLWRAGQINARDYADEIAATVPTLYPAWKSGEVVREGDRRYYPPAAKLYKVRAGQGHTTQDGWTPDLTPALWEVLDVAHIGTLDDPIPAARGMEYIYGRHYADPEDGKVYLCRRAGEAEGGAVNLQYLPHELVGQYFEEEGR